MSKPAFAKLTIHQQRVLVCKDARERIKRRNLLPFFSSLWRGMPLPYDTSGKALQRHLNTQSRACEVCAKGAILMSWVGLFDSISKDALPGESNTMGRLWPVELVNTFGHRLLAAMETAFERTCYCWCGPHLTEPEILALTYLFAYTDSSTDRLLALLSNIIRNRGRLIIGEGEGRLVFD